MEIVWFKLEIASLVHKLQFPKQKFSNTSFNHNPPFLVRFHPRQP
jgi:hypothetical protein